MTLASGDQKNPTIAQPPGGSYTVIVWEDYRNGESDIYAQKIDNVNGIAMWFPIDGVPVCTAAGEQRNPRAAFDGDGDIIICWEDYRNDPTVFFSEIWATKVLNADGTEALNWSGGTSVSGTGGYTAYRPRIVGTNDGAFITWTDTRNSLTVPPVNNCDIYAQYLLSSSPTPTAWTANGICVNATMVNDQKNSEIVLDYIPEPSTGRYGVVIAYESIFKGYSEIKMDRIDASGSRVWGDLTVAPYDGDQYNVKIDHAGLQSTPTGPAMMVVATWEDWRNYGATSVDVYAQMVRADIGESQWPNTSSPTGLEIAAASNRQLKPDIVANGTCGVAVIAWEDRRNGGNDIDIYANRVILSSQALAAVNGVAVSNTGENEQSICMTKYTNMLNVWIGWERSGNIYYQKYDWSSFTEQLASNGWPVTIAKGDQTSPVVGAGVFVYEDGRRQTITNDDQNDLNIYAQIPGDECDIPTYMHWKDVLANWTPNSYTSDKRFAVDGEGNTYVTWYEIRVTNQSGDGTPGIYAQKLDKDGVPRWQNDGVLLSANSDCGLPDVAAYTNGSAVFVWREDLDIRVAMVSANGVISWRSYCTNFYGTCDQPRVAVSQSDIYVVNRDGNAVHYDVFNGNGSVVYSNWVVKNGNTYVYPKICTDGTNGCYVAALSYDYKYLLCQYIDKSTPPLPKEFQRSGITPLYTSIDLAIDRIQYAVNFPPYAIVAYTDAGAAYIMKIGFHAIQRRLSGPEPYLDAVIASGTGEYSSICVASDSLADPVQMGGGAIVAWDHHEYVPSIGDWSHIVQTQRVSWLANSLSMQWSSPLNLIDYTYRQGLPTYPDIAWKWNPGATGSYGVVGWQDIRGPWCQGGDAFIAQCVDYLEPNSTQAILWSADGESISPQYGATAQTSIQLERCPDQSGISAISGYWLDTRAGSPIVAGTKIDDYIIGTGHDITIRKEGNSNKVESPALSLQLAQSYPNPVSPSRHGGTTIGFTLPSEGQYAIRLYDAMGRLVSTMVTGWLKTGSYVYSIDGSVLSHLPTGVYRYELTANGRRISRQMILVN